jgi:hypothetical protein
LGVGRLGHNRWVSEEMVSRESRNRASARVEDLQWLVRVPGRPEAIRAFTGAERGDADGYAAKFDGATVEPLH